MAGGIFEPRLDEDFQDWQPLSCYLCKQQFDTPCLLDCLHTFCQSCLAGRAVDGKLACPVCGEETVTQACYPPEDDLFLALLKAAAVEDMVCANCDKQSVEMLYCNTCGQTMCPDCNVHTHKARMFSSHDIVQAPLAINNKDKCCRLHQEALVLFHRKNRLLLCVKCFQELPDEEKIQCIDIDVAFGHSVTNLETAIQGVMQGLNATRTAIMEHDAAKERLQTHTDTEIRAIDRLCSKLITAIKTHADALSSNINRNQATQEYRLVAATKQLSCCLPVLYQHISVSEHLLQNTNKYTFLVHVHKLIKRCALLCRTKQPTQPEYIDSSPSDFKAEFKRVLMPLLGQLGNTKETANKISIATQTPSGLSATSTRSLDNGNVTEIIPAVDVDHFKMVELHVTRCQAASCPAADCRETHSADFENKQKLLQQDLDNVKVKLQELQRDFTQRHCLSRQSTVSTVYQMCQRVETESGQQLQGLQQHQAQLDKTWEEKMQEFSTQKAVNEEHLGKASKMCEESSQLMAFATQLLPFIQSITDVAERIAPELEESKKKSEQKDQMSALFHEISTIHPDSGHRVDAIKTVEEERQTQMANRVNPLDDELRKTKDMLKSPSLRQRRASTPRREGVSSKSGREGKDAATPLSHEKESQERMSPEGHCDKPETTHCGHSKQSGANDSSDNHDGHLDPYENLNESLSNHTPATNGAACLSVDKDSSSVVKSVDGGDIERCGTSEVQVIAKFKAKQERKISKKKSLEKRNSWSAESQRDPKNQTAKASESQGGPRRRGSSHEPQLETARERLLHDIKTFENNSLQKVSKSHGKSSKK